ncbi:gamma-glutamylcyclotransferase family protein [Moellerella wisconsensis]|uniref:Gamma-glutamylcyclotransferase n=2 Tax=Moellerella wisconsensis TaxID=158849 RepID=A0ACD3Y6T0_9GAMM|nr:gamma-glutamylcyclotransferase [Moellerella wisconsensis]KLN98089.1 gamma-glutamylcyclotransferase [Moellerella wisconsensis]UNH23978.1 gamma-glutamylcyclotransferase [Moellerella wisconsensis]UNH27061.1 gamma-glutamylcyclotransferase [Moellerella wisconsensis]UNH30534.1 gamma-glutamylcyclotransferase [Moellerella wisconsensis]UNH38695.1 gamma-glutamylcyclotransferase [Moellerella wisconsensis]
MRIIVYGSLRQDQGNHHWMTYAQLLGKHRLQGYDIYDLGYYPAVVCGEGSVECEVYRITPSILTELDELKKNSQDYERELIQTPYGSAWIYLYKLPVDGLQRIESGDWLKRHEK